MRRINTTAVVLAVGLFVAAMSGRAVRAQQHSYTTQDIEQGRMLYDSNCGRCHGDTGAGVSGVELFKQIKRATSDEDIAKIIQAGIPNTGMPSHQFSDQQALAVVAFLRSMSGAAPALAPAGGNNVPSPLLAGGDAARGKQIFEGKGACLKCHAVNGAGGNTGPDLTAIGRPAPARGFGAPSPNIPYLQRSILDPNADIAMKYRVYEVTLKSGEQVRGTLLNQDTFTVQLLDGSQRLRSFMKSDLRSFGFLESPMPSYRGTLSDQEVTDLLSYLVSLKG